MRVLKTLLLTAIVAVAGAATASAETSTAADIPIAEAELATMRGGFDLGGFSFSFGATLNTLVDGQLALQTVVTYLPGAVSTVVTPGAGVTSAMGDQALAGLSGRGISVIPGSTPIFSTADGATAFLQGLTQQGLVNVTLNTAAGRVITSNADLTLVIPNGVAFQHDILTQRAIQNLNDQIAAGMLANHH